ncbi:MAG: phage head spike fiber domain-containing protein [Bryobacteraceae bacterium]
MAIFPQLTTGALAAYPFTKVRTGRTLQNLLPDGRRIAVADPEAARLEWELHYRGLTTVELQAIESLFAASEGRLKTFTFLDPTDNLLSDSENFAGAAWTADPLLQVTGGFADPVGGSNAFRLVNSAQTTQGIRQPIAASGVFEFSFSVYMRSTTGATANLRILTASSSQFTIVTTSPTWQRRSLSGALSVDETPVTFAIETGPGVSVDVFGAQVDAQPFPAPYRKTLAQGGVYASARFDQDEISVVTEGPERHSLTVRISSRP